MLKKINNFLKSLFTKNIKQHKDLSSFYKRAEEPLQEEVLNMVDQLYTGDNHESQLISFMEYIPEMRAMSRSCYYNLPRAVDCTNMLCEKLSDPEIDEKTRAALGVAMFGKYDPDDPDYDDFSSQGDFNSQMRNVISQVFDDEFVQQVREKNEQNEAIDKLFSRGDGPGGQESDNPEFMQWLSNNLDSQTLKNILKTFGKFNTVINKRKKEITENGYDDIKDVILGNDLSMLVEDEFINLCDEDLEDLFYIGYVNETLLEFVTESKIAKDQGPLTLFVDISGSMAAKIGDTNANRYEMACGFALAICKQMEFEKRGYSICVYDTRSRGVWSSLHGNSLSDMFKGLVCLSWGGNGTELGNTLEATLPKVDKDEDIIVITDGNDLITEPHSKMINDFKEEQSTKLSILLVGAGQANESLRGISDSLICVSNDNTEKGMIQMIEKEILPGENRV